MRAGKAGWFGVSAILLSATIALIAIAAFPFATVRHRLDQWSGDGSADLYTVSVHQRFQLAAAVSAAILVLLFIALWAGRRRVESRAQDLCERLGREARQIYRATRTTLGRSGHWILLIVLVAGLVRVIYLDIPLRSDEAHTYVKYASQPLPLVVTRYDEPNNHILHSVAVHIATRVLGNDPWAIRLPALLAGVVLAGLTVVLGTRADRRPTGVAAGLIVACLPDLIEYSVDARGYTLTALLFAISLLSADLAARQSNLLAAAITCLTLALSIWTVPTMVYGVIALAVWLWLNTRRTKPIAVGLAATAIISIALYLPVVLAMGLRQFLYVSGGERLPPIAAITEIPAMLAASYRWTLFAVPAPVQLILAGGLLTALLADLPWFGERSGTRRTGYVWYGVVAALAVVMTLIFQGVVPPPRIWCFAIPPLAVGVAIGIAHWGRFIGTRLGVARATESLAAAIAIWIMVTTIGQDAIRTPPRSATFPEAKKIMQFISETVRPKEPIAAVTPTVAPLVYHAHRTTVPEVHFMLAGTGVTDDRSAIVVTSRQFDQQVVDVLEELNIDELFDSESAVLLKAFESGSVYRVQGRSQSLPR